MILKQSTSVTFGIGPFLDEMDGKTPETALSISQSDIRLKKNSGNWAQINAAGTLTHEENGWYELTLDATDTDTAGILIVAIHKAGALPVWKEFNVGDPLEDVILADSIPTDGTRPTMRQAMYMTVQYLFERSVSGTTVTVKKVDGSTSLFTLTISDASNPTSITRAT